MNKLIICAYALTILCCGCSPKDNPMIETVLAPEQGQELSFHDPHGSYTITVKQRKHIQYARSGPESFIVDYIVTLGAPIFQTPGSLLISFQDKNGFEITRRPLGRIVQNYTGDMKGSFALTADDWKKISNAELVFYVSKEDAPFLVEIDLNTNNKQPQSSH